MVTFVAAAAGLGRGVGLIQVGYDVDGNKTACVRNLLQTTCTATFEPDDRLMMQCRAAGGDALECDCHRGLCRRRIAPPLTQPSG